MNINSPLPGNAIALPFTKAANPEKREEVVHKLDRSRVPLAHLLPDSVRGHFVAMLGEFVGTVLFLFFALGGTQVANNIPSSSGLTVAEQGANPQQLQYIALCFGFSLAVNAWVFFRISGGLFNPAVTVGMCLIGALPWLRGALLFLAQVLAGICAAALVSCMLPGPLNVTTALGGGTSVVQGVFLEMMLTAQLVFTIFMLAAEKHKSTFIAPVGIGLSLFIAELVGVYFTGGSLNPARSLGPAVVIASFHSYHWIYWVGPMLGALLAAAFYKFIKALEYETANPSKDDEATELHHREDQRVDTGDSHSYGDFASKTHEEENGVAPLTQGAPLAENVLVVPNDTAVRPGMQETRKSSRRSNMGSSLNRATGYTQMPEDHLYGEDGRAAEHWNSGLAMNIGTTSTISPSTFERRISTVDRRAINRGASYQA
ncbi:hypothetical protein LTR62_002254 [Meristemomyces frigidus]|uniref:Aquaporin n=1 Tax=Meristemomyces frigidus TaxID=1508187 RepID=A0AAN7YQA5_9PEZI|nr:hypothetical protein LTR62_002254 [Meristemomyces frigidus]